MTKNSKNSDSLNDDTSNFRKSSNFTLHARCDKDGLELVRVVVLCSIPKQNDLLFTRVRKTS